MFYFGEKKDRNSNFLKSFSKNAYCVLIVINNWQFSTILISVYIPNFIEIGNHKINSVISIFDKSNEMMFYCYNLKVWIINIRIINLIVVVDICLDAILIQFSFLVIKIETAMLVG